MKQELGLLIHQTVVFQSNGAGGGGTVENGKSAGGTEGQRSDSTGSTQPNGDENGDEVDSGKIDIIAYINTLRENQEKGVLPFHRRGKKTI